MATAERDWLTFDGTSFSTGSFVGAWMLAATAYGVGDVVTTVALVWFSPLYVEANPVIAAAIGAFGGGGFLAVKLLVFYGSLGLSLWAGLPDEDPLMFYGPPLLLAVFGVVTTGLNLGLML